MIKKVLKHIVPVTIKIFYKEITELKKFIETRIKSIKKTINENKRILSEELMGLQQKDEALEKDIQRIDRKIDTLIDLVNKTNTDVRGSRKALESQAYELLDPELYPHAIKQWYTNVTGQILDLDNPKTYNEKIQWLKLNDKNPLKTVLSDKLLVRDWVKMKIGEKYLIPLLGVYRRGKDIDFESLPNSFVLKANHGSGMNAIVKDKSTANLNELRRISDIWLRTNYAFNYGYELQYMNIPRLLIAEEYEENAEGDLPDYKCWCFNGKVHFIEVITGRQGNTQMGFFDTNWNLLPFTTGAYKRIDNPIEKPSQLDEMIHVAEKLSEGFKHVRVDLYIIKNGQLKFGEMTFTSGSGVAMWNPPEADFEVGKLLDIM